MKLKIFKKQLLILVFLLLLQNSSAFLGTLAALLNGAGMIIEFIKSLPSAVQSVKELISSFTGGSPNSVTAIPENVVPVTPIPVILDTTTVKDLGPIIEQYHREFVEKFEEVDTKLGNLRLFTAERFRQIQQLINNLPQEIDSVLKRKTVTEFIANINTEWNRVMGFVRLGVNKRIYSRLMTTNLNYIELNLVNFRVAITPSASLTFTDSGLLTEIATMQKNRAHTLCNGETSHHSIMQIFHLIISTEVKTFILRALALNNDFPEDKAWEVALNQSETELKQQMTRYFAELKTVLAVEEIPYIRGCISEGTNFHSVVPYKWQYFFAKADARNCIPIDTTFGCSNLNSCEAIKNGLENVSESCRAAQTLLQLMTLVRDDPVIEELMDVGSVDLYKNVEFDGKKWKFPGRPAECAEEIAASELKFCKCACLTYENFVLALMQSRVQYNYVVVAMRFQKTGNYIYFQIAEGKLEGNAYISDFSWIQPTQKRNGENPFEALMTVNGRETISLNDVLLPHEYVLTGIKFSPQLVYSEKGFKIGLYGVKFDYETGKLDTMEEIFILESQRELSDTEECLITTAPNSSSSQYSVAEFRLSDYKHPDSPRTLPYLNSLPVQPNPLSPIGGVGIFYEIPSENFPCLSLRLFAIDYMSYLHNFEKLNITVSIDV